MNWTTVNDNDESTLPPMEKVVFLCYPSGYDGGHVLQVGARCWTEAIDDDTMGWAWHVHERGDLAQNWEFKLIDLEMNDDYQVTHWAEIEWPSL